MTCHASHDVAQAYQYCLRIARAHYENFPVASRLLRRELRAPIAAIYAFARHADDLADEGDAPPETRLKKLDAWETLLKRCLEQRVEHPVFLALGDTIRQHQLPVEPLFDLLVAFRMDVSIHRYATRQELAFYCRHSANPIGRLMLALHGIDNGRAIACSDALCTALQLTNFWQDLSIDRQRGRHYLPDEWQAEDVDTPEALKTALQCAIAWTESFYRQGAQLLPMLPLRLRLQAAATLHGGRSILRRVEACPDPLHQRPRLSRADWRGMAPRILFDALVPIRHKEARA
ncbi:MAG: squalene synthase HpnC [Zetaproteobacteria bacterium]|nr:MAG: squalene synthase HpnC [Zetaproteobacteria bacterium]